MKIEQLFSQFEIITDANDGVQKFKEYIINLGIKGQLTKQSDDDLPVEEILERVNKQKEELYNEKKIPKPKYAELDSNIISPFEIPDSWRWHSLDEISVYIQRGKSPKYSEEDRIPVVSQKCIQWEGFDFSRVRFIDPETLDKYQVYRFLRKGDLLWNSTGTGTIGRINLYDDSNEYDKVVADSHVTIVRTGDAINEKYIMYWIASGLVQNDFEEVASGTTKQKELNTSTAKAFPVPIPPLEEQRRIVQKIEILFSQVGDLEQKVQQDRQVDERLQVAVLDDLQSAETPEASRRSWQRLTDHFEQIYRKSEHIDQLKQAILNEAVRGRLVPQEPNDEPAEKLLERIKEEKQRLYAEGEIRKPKDLPEIKEEEIPYELPEGWKWERVGHMFEIERGSSPRPKGDPRYFASNRTDYHWIKISDITAYKKNNYLTDTDEFLTKEGTGHSRKVNDKDIIIAASGSVGKASLLGIEGYIYDGLMAIKYVKPEPLRRFMYLYLKTKIESFEKESTGTSWKNINTEILNNTIIPIPPLQQQEKILSKLTELYSWCDDLKEKLSRSQQTDQRLLEALVNSALEEDEESKEPEEATIYQMPNVRVKHPKLSKVSGMNLTDVQAGMIARVMNDYERYRGEKAHLGRTKMEKTCHIIESHVGIDLGRKPKRMKHGSADYQRLRRKVEPRAKKLGWFDFEEDENGVVYYKKGTRFHEPFQKLGRKLVEMSDEIDRIIELFVPLSAHDAEVRQTVYAAWHDLLAFGKDPTDEEIVLFASTERYWAKEKEDIPKKEFYEGIDWLRKNDLVPDGTGKLTVKE